MKYDIKDINLAKSGLIKIEWAKKDMPVLLSIASDFKKIKPFKNITKIIISKNQNLKLDNGFTLASSPHDAIKKLESMGFKKAILTGGSKNNSSFAKLDLIDEVFIYLEGVIIGKGIPLFSVDYFELKLKLLNVTKITENILRLHYKVLK